MEDLVRRQMRKFSDVIFILFFLVSELLLAHITLITFAPVTAQKAKNYIHYMTCPYSVKNYDFTIKVDDSIEKYEVLETIGELNTRIGFELFSYKMDSKNYIIITPSIKQTFLSSKAIGQTTCSDLCCGKDRFKVEFDDNYLYDPLKFKIIAWHELGHVVGLDHDDSRPDIMNTVVMDNKFYSPEVEQTFINKVLKQMGNK